jgi:hypothetical protein
MTCSTTVENVLQIGPVFFKTKPISTGAKMCASFFFTEDYENECRPAAWASKANPSTLLRTGQSQMPAFWLEARSTKPEIRSRFAASTKSGYNSYKELWGNDAKRLPRM